MAELSDATVKEFKEAFSLFDLNGDGFISLDELFQGLKVLGEPPSEEILKGIISDIDADESNSIDFAEFLTLMARKTRQKDERGELLAAFRIFDRDGDGLMTASDIVDIMEAFGEYITDEEGKAILAQADTNKDGFIDPQEFLSFMEEKK